MHLCMYIVASVNEHTYTYTHHTLLSHLVFPPGKQCSILLFRSFQWIFLLPDEVDAVGFGVVRLLKNASAHFYTHNKHNRHTYIEMHTRTQHKPIHNTPHFYTQQPRIDTGMHPSNTSKEPFAALFLCGKCVLFNFIVLYSLINKSFDFGASFGRSTYSTYIYVFIYIIILMVGREKFSEGERKEVPRPPAQWGRARASASPLLFFFSISLSPLEAIFSHTFSVSSFYYTIQYIMKGRELCFRYFAFILLNALILNCLRHFSSLPIPLSLSLYYISSTFSRFWNI